MTSTCVIFVSIKYHTLHNSYVERRLKELGDSYRLRILLVFVDDIYNTKSLNELNIVCYKHNFILILSLSEIESARYIECMKEYEGKTTNIIKEKNDNLEFKPKFTKILTNNIKSINKTDTTTLLDMCSTVSNIFAITKEQLTIIPGLGDKKVKRLFEVFNEPFIQK